MVFFYFEICFYLDKCREVRIVVRSFGLEFLGRLFIFLGRIFKFFILAVLVSVFSFLGDFIFGLSYIVLLLECR